MAKLVILLTGTRLKTSQSKTPDFKPPGLTHLRQVTAKSPATRSNGPAPEWNEFACIHFNNRNERIYTSHNITRSS
jgi:hypothetical protein